MKNGAIVNNEELEELYVVNSTGEILDKLESATSYAKLSEGDKVVRKGVLQYLSDTVDIKYRFVKINPLVYEKIAKKYPIVNTLIKYIGYGDGILSYKNGRFIKMKDIPKICNVSESTAKRQIKGLFLEDVIHKVRDKQKKQTYLLMNPWVAYIGRKIYLSLYDEFKLSEHRSNCEEWDK